MPRPVSSSEVRGPTSPSRPPRLTSIRLSCTMRGRTNLLKAVKWLQGLSSGKHRQIQLAWYFFRTGILEVGRIVWDEALQTLAEKRLQPPRWKAKPTGGFSRRGSRKRTAKEPASAAEAEAQPGRKAALAAEVESAAGQVTGFSRRGSDARPQAQQNQEYSCNSCYLRILAASKR